MNTNLYKINSLADSLDDDFRKGKILNGVKYGLRDYLKYVDKSMKLVQKTDAIRIPLRKVVVEKNTKEDTKQKETRYYLDLGKLNDKISTKIESELFKKEVRTVYSNEVIGNRNKDQQNELSIVDRNEDEKYLLINSEVDLKFIYLKANDYQLGMQRKAIIKLLNKPLSFYAPIQKLFDRSSEAISYYENNKTQLNYKIDWKILKNPEKFEGTSEQQNFIEKALKTNDFALLEGPPGSGKTTAIIELIIQLIKQNKKVLLVSSTHVAVDNVFHRILTTYKNECEGLVVPIRIANDDGVIRKESVTPYRFKRFTGSIKQDIRGYLKRKTSESATLLEKTLSSGDSFDKIILESANLVGGTMIGILQHPAIKSEGIQDLFDVMIVDEASKVTFLDFLVPALYAKKWILVGDVNQLSPYTEDDFINENIDAVLENKKQKKHLISSFELRKKLNSSNKWDKESVKVFFAKIHEGSEFENKIIYHLQENFNPEEDVLKLNSAEIIICAPTEKNRQNLSNHLYVKAMMFEGSISTSSFSHRQNHFHKDKRRKGGMKTYPFEFINAENQEWKEMVGSRLGQMYQYRFEPELNKQIKQEYDYLVPKEYQDEVEKIRRIALPSILELLQIGAGEKLRTTVKGETYREDSLVYTGFDEYESVKRIKFQSLSYQHRMHEDIASAPRNAFYKGRSLETANTVEEREDILAFYKPNEKKVIWVSNSDKTFRQRIKNGKARNINPTEVQQVKHELKQFIDLAKNRKPKFEIAVLTFYRDQEFELRKMLRELTNQKEKMKFFKTENVKITLCTVDKFQGDEADMALLSFTKFTKRAFYNSPNRLNVALTRARYKLVLYGNKEWLAKNAQLESLRQMAEEQENRLTH